MYAANNRMSLPPDYGGTAFRPRTYIGSAPKHPLTSVPPVPPALTVPDNGRRPLYPLRQPGDTAKEEPISKEPYRFRHRMPIGVREEEPEEEDLRLEEQNDEPENALPEETEGGSVMQVSKSDEQKGLSMSEDDLLLIALMILLAEEGGENREVLFLLILLFLSGLS